MAEDNRKIQEKAVAAQAPLNEFIIIGKIRHPGIGKGNGMGFPRISDDDEGETITIFPVSERFYLIIYGEVRWLQEMYDVELLAINNSMTDTIENCEASLTLPDGLSFAEMVDTNRVLFRLSDILTRVEVNQFIGMGE